MCCGSTVISCARHASALTGLLLVTVFAHCFFFREVLSNMVRRQFRSRASWPWRDVEAIEGWLARGRAQLQQLRTAPFDGVTVYRPRDPPSGPPPAS
jgi:hypothetical protein